MVWRRVPPFSWAGATVAYTLLVTCSVMLAALTMLTLDRNFDGVFFDPNEGGSAVLYQHLSSIFLAGAYISVVIGAFGAISEILPTFSRQPHFGLPTIGGSFAALAVLAVLAWMQNMLAAPIPIGFLYFAMLMAVAAVIPVGLIVFNWLGTLSGGALRMRAPVVFAVGSVVLTLYGLLGELMQSIVPVGWQIEGTAAAQGDTYAALIGAGVLGGFAALYYWFPKLSGRFMGESLGRASFWAIFLGAVVMVVPMQIAGLEGMPADVYKFYEGEGLDLVNLLTSLGTFVFASGVILTLVNAASSYGRGVGAGPDPWGGTTLEWFTASPPPVHNFDVVPDVRSDEPMRDVRDAVAGRRAPAPPSKAESGEPVA
jgi:cytochrome c oxidase subunit 1